uniref:Envelope glycoprotein n=1 Tax=Naja naja TaxID=35670 RepID=A0A8C6V3H2_NAJNA
MMWLFCVTILGLLLNPRGTAGGDDDKCQPCIKATKSGLKVTKTLIYHTQLDCKKKLKEICIINGTSYSICGDDGKKQCYDPKGATHRFTIKVSTNQHDACGQGTYCGDWKCVDFRSRGFSVRLDTIPKDNAHKKLYVTRVQANDTCYQHTCNLINLTFPVPQNWLTTQTWKGYQDDYGLGIDGTGSDPGVVLKILISKHDLDPIAHSLFHSYYEEMRKVQGMTLPPKAQNMFLALAETIQWPWEAQEVTYTYVQENQHNYTFKRTGEEIWAVTTNLVGNICYQRNQTDSRKTYVGSSRCLGIWENGTWWSGENITTPEKSLEKIENMSFLSRSEEDSQKWITPDGLYWVCGRYAYNSLPKDWYGSCVLGAIRPSFFLLPLRQRQVLGVPVYEEIGNIRVKRDTKGIHKGLWKDDEWPPERVIHYYEPAMWAEDGTHGYRTPIYLLNHLICLQAVVEIITNETILAMKHLAVESAKSRTYIMQNRLALDYLLAKEGGVCGKFNLTNCIEIDDSGKVIQEITNRMVKIAHVPVQTWKGFNMNNLFGSWFPNLPGLQAIVALIGIIAAGCVVLPCILPIFIKTITSTLSLIAKKQVSEQIMSLRLYQTVPTSEDKAEILLHEFETELRKKKGGVCEQELSYVGTE